MKNIINKLKTGNYTEDDKREIYDFDTTRVTKEYLSQFSKDRLATERAMKSFDNFAFSILALLTTIIVYLASFDIAVHSLAGAVVFGVTGIILIALNIKNK
jgi:hypothetical protein